MKRLLVFALLFSAAVALFVDPIHGQNSSSPTTKTAVFAGGCFWCIQPAFDKAKGVIKTVVGYSGGTEPNPTYQLVSSEKTGYRESIEITYDPTRISYDQLLDIYWRQIDPTQADGQFTDIGPSYRAAIFYNNSEERKIAEASKEKLALSGKFDKSIVTEILSGRGLSSEILRTEPGALRGIRKRIRAGFLRKENLGPRAIACVRALASTQYGQYPVQMKSLTYTAARENLASTINRVCEDHAPIVITKNRDQVVVMLSLEEYESLQETAHLLRSPANAKRLIEAVDALERGKGLKRKLKL